LRSYVRIFVPDLNDAEDVLQETAMAIAKDFHRYDAARPFLEWAVGVARNRVMQHFRKAGQRRRFIFSDATVALIEEGFFRVEHNYDHYHDALEFCLGRLPARSRKLIELRYLSGMAVPQVAESIGLTVQSVYTRLSQVRTALRECIQRRMNQEGAPS
jgi:RNA polymerase sigma-70 factor